VFYVRVILFHVLCIIWIWFIGHPTVSCVSLVHCSLGLLPQLSQRINKSIPAWFGIVYLPFEMTRHTDVPSLGTVRIYSWKGHALCDSVAERALWSRSATRGEWETKYGRFMTLNKTFLFLVCPVRFLVIATVRDFLWNHHCYSLLHTTIQTGFHAEAFCTQNIHPINNLLRPQFTI